MKAATADLLLNRPVLLPDGSVWRYRKRQTEEGAERRREMEMMRKRAKKAQRAQ